MSKDPSGRSTGRRERLEAEHRPEEVRRRLSERRGQGYPRGRCARRHRRVRDDVCCCSGCGGRGLSWARGRSTGFRKPSGGRLVEPGRNQGMLLAARKARIHSSHTYTLRRLRVVDIVAPEHQPAVPAIPALSPHGPEHEDPPLEPGRSSSELLRTPPPGSWVTGWS
jgi:hypothetical protein